MRGFLNAVSRKKAYYWFLTNRLCKQRNAYATAWIELFEYRQNRKAKMAQVATKIHLKSLNKAYLTWKKESYFCRVLDLIYTYRYQEEERSLLKSCFREWSRYLKHRQQNPYKKQSLELKHRENVLRFTTSKWKLRCRERLFAIKLQHVLESRYRESFDRIEERARVND